MLKKLLALLGLSSSYTKTFDSIVAPINKVIVDLESHVNVQTELKNAKNRLIEEAQLAIKFAEDEASKALAAAEKFKALVS